MSDERYAIEPLGSHHDRRAFASGVEPLDRYFHEQAGQDQRRRLAAVFLLRDTVESTIAGYCTLSATGIEAASLPVEVTRRLPRYPLLPAILLGRLAVDRRYRGRGLGELLLGDAVRRAAAQDQVAAMALVVDAKDEAARQFYEHYGFRRFMDAELRLFLPLATVARA
jgi:ribosomal protein S18 acetylase RimI-like enzyme